MSVDVAIIIQSILIAYLYYRLCRIQASLKYMDDFMKEQINFNIHTMEINESMEQRKANK